MVRTFYIVYRRDNIELMKKVYSLIVDCY